MEQMKYLIHIYAICWIFSDVEASLRVKRGFCSTRNLDIENGDYTLRSSNSIAKFSCNRGFQIYGSETLVCFGHSWNTDPPLCIANTCTNISATSVMRVEEEYNGAVLKFSCAALYKLEGSAKLLCTGKAWTDQAPTCQPWDPPLSCDLENPDICGWYHDDTGDQEWRWNTGETPTSRTGPSHDHTLGQDGDGHYMYFETSSPTRPDHQALLSSPIYPAAYSQDRCFSFWYHIHGSGDIGDLELFIKPEGADIKTLTPVFHNNEDGGDVWYQASVHVTPQDTDFQIVFVATRATSYRSDYAIDDFRLGDCTNTISPIPDTTQASANVTTTVHGTTVVDKTRTSPRSTNRTTKRPTTLITTKTTTRPPTTTTTTTKTTIQTTVKSTAETTTRPKTTQTSVTTRQSTHKKTLKSSTVPLETTVSPNTTLKPVVNPTFYGESKARIVEPKDDTSKIIYIVIGVGLAAALVAGIIAGIIIYRRRMKKHNLQRASLSSTNPLYKIMAGDEAAVHFAVDPDDES